VEAFLAQAAADPGVWIAAGHCFEQFGSSEAYLPVLEAVRCLGQGPGGEHLRRLLAGHAVPEVPAPRAQGVTQERLLREVAEALEALAAEVPLVLVLEDLHWSDYSTLDLVSALAHRRQSARLLLLATYRPADAVLSGHPLRAVRHELLARRLGQELALGPLNEAAVAEYLTARLPGGLPDGLPRLLHRRTEGHPLFLVSLVDDWLAQGLLAPSSLCEELTADLHALEVGVPDSVRAVIEKQLDRLDADERQALEGASVAGVEFSAAAAAAALDEDVVRVEECCEGLARRHKFLQPLATAEWPDGTVSGRYRFGHELYHRVVAERLAAARRRRLHQRLGERLEAAYGAQAREVAAELAVHFEQGRDHPRAAHYLSQAAERAVQRSGHREAIDYLRRALAAVERLPGPERASRELRLQAALGALLQAAQGFAAPGLEQAFSRARVLCQEVTDDRELFPVLWGLWLYHGTRAESQVAAELTEQLLALAHRAQDPALLVPAHLALLELHCIRRGDFAAARAHLERGMALYDPEQHGEYVFRLGFDPGVVLLGWGALALHLLGYPDQALTTSCEAVALARAQAHPFGLAWALSNAAVVDFLRRDLQTARGRAEELLALATEQGFPSFVAAGTHLRGSALAAQGRGAEGFTLLREGSTAWCSTGALVWSSWLQAALAEASGQAGQIEDRLAAVAAGLAFAQGAGERFYEAGLHRLKGELLLLRPQAPPPVQAEAEACFRQALDVARRQQARSWELRAVMSLSRLYQRQGRQAEARPLLAKTYGWFTEGFDTSDLREAKALLDELS
jgi:predicted ATPase